MEISLEALLALVGIVAGLVKLHFLLTSKLREEKERIEEEYNKLRKKYNEQWSLNNKGALANDDIQMICDTAGWSAPDDWPWE